MANKIIKAQMKQRRDTKANWAAQNPVLLAGELGIVSDDPNLYKVGDGTSAWNALPFRGFDGTIVQESGTSENTVMSQKAVTGKLAALSSELTDGLKPLENLTETKETDITGPLKDGYFNVTTGSFVVSEAYMASDFIPVHPGETIKVTAWVTSTIVASIAFWDIYKNPLLPYFQGPKEKGTYDVLVPDGAYYVTLCSVKSNIFLASIKAARTSSNAYNKDEINVMFAGLHSDIQNVQNKTLQEVEEALLIDTSLHTENGSNGYWRSDNGNFYEDNSRRATNKIEVQTGETYLVTTFLRPAAIAAVSIFAKDGSYLGLWYKGTGEESNLIDEPFTIEEGVGYIAINSASTFSPVVKKQVKREEFAAYTKNEIDAKLKADTINAVKKYGVLWNMTDPADLGQRCFSAEGLIAEAGIGSEGGHSDFDSIFPWSEIKRCNLRTTENGAKVVTYEGEEGFALDGSNGDVFVRIPKFKTNRYTEKGKMIVVIGEGYTHPAFVENGTELDEIFVGAYEASKTDEGLRSRKGVMPANNEVGNAFLTAAKNRGEGYTLFDMRTADAIWRLMAVEHGCRNSNQILGYGYSDYRQADAQYTYLFAKTAKTNTNQIVLPAANSKQLRLIFMTEFAVGNNILFCEERQDNIIAQRKITSIKCDNFGDDMTITFDGDPINISTATFIGNAPCDCGYCEDLGAEYALTWHTGRANKPPLEGSEKPINALNPCRYRWIENIVGNVWHFLPDVLFVDAQMYVCNNIKDYALDLNLESYTPIGDKLPIQSTNGHKSDINTTTNPNFWMTKMLNDTFAKGSAFGKEFDTKHDGLLSSMGFGGYYYLNTGSRLVVHGGGFDHLWRSNILTFRASITANQKWFLYGGRLMYKHIK